VTFWRDDEGNCDRFEALIAARHDAALAPAAESLLVRHLASCEGCRSIDRTMSPPADAAGDRAQLPEIDLGNYALGREVARGGMGRILAARDLRIGRPVAVKELLGQSPGLAARFEREARVTARLQHPGIVPIYEIGRWPDGTPFYSMRMVEGQTLRDAIADAKSLTARLALLPAVIAATEAVAFAHDKRVIHRDLTPMNVLVGAYGETVVIDWGLAKDLTADPEAELAMGGAEADGLTQYGIVLGTAAYMPPEQARGEPVDERADVYALGALLYHLLAGAPPYREKGDELLAAVRAGPPVPLEAITRGTPSDLISIVTKAMARRADDRYPSALELAAELGRFRTGRMVVAHAYTRGERFARFVRRHRALLGAGTFALIALVTIGGLALRNVVRSRADAQASVVKLLEREGVSEMFGGNSHRGLAYLAEAYVRGDRSRALSFIIGAILDNVPPADATLLDCGGDVRAITFSPDGAWVAAACNARMRVWNHGSRAVAFTIEDAGVNHHLVYSHDGAMIVSFGAEGVVRGYDGRTGAPRLTLRHDGVSFAAFAADGEILVTVGHDGWARIWNARKGVELRSIRAAEPSRSVHAALSHDGRQLVTVAADGIGATWDVATGAVRARFEHGAAVGSLAVTSDGSLAVTCSNDQHKVWDLRAGGRLVRELTGAISASLSCEIDRDGARLLALEQGGGARLWRLRDGVMFGDLWDSTATLAVQFSPDGQRVVRVAGNGAVRVNHARSQAALGAYDSQGGRVATFSPRDGSIAVARGDGRICLWPDTNGALLGAFGLAPGERFVAVSPSGADALVADTHNALALRRVIGGRTPAPPLTIGSLREPAVLRGALVAVSPGGDIRRVDLVTGISIALPLPPLPLELKSDLRSERVVATYRDRPAWLWDARSGARALADAEHAVVADDGRAVALISAATPPCIWTSGPCHPLQAAAGSRVVAVTPLHVITAADHADTIRATIFELAGRRVADIDGLLAMPTVDPQGRYLTTIRPRGTEVWRLADGARTQVIDHPLQSAQVDPSGTLIVGIEVGRDYVSLFDTSDGRMIGSQPTAEYAPDKIASTVRWSPAGDRLVTVSNMIAVWRVNTTIDSARLMHALRETVPWRVEGGRLRAIRSRLRGAVTRNGAIVPGATVKLFGRRRDLAVEPGSRLEPVAMIEVERIETDEAGRYAFEDLAVGLYSLQVDGTAERFILEPSTGEVVKDVVLAR
jgi:WD40 repeat protein